MLIAVATILSIIVSSCLSLLFVKRFGPSGIIEAQASTFMGAMMGAMLGVMLTTNFEIVIMLIASNLFFIISITFTLALLNNDTGKKQFFAAKRVAFYVVLVLCLSVISGLGALELTNPVEDGSNMDMEQQSHEH